MVLAKNVGFWATAKKEWSLSEIYISYLTQNHQLNPIIWLSWPCDLILTSKITKNDQFLKKSRCHRYSRPQSRKSIKNSTSIFVVLKKGLLLCLFLICLKALKRFKEDLCNKLHNICYRYGRAMFDTSKKLPRHVCLNEWHMTPLTSVIYTNHVDYNIKSDFQGQFSTTRRRFSTQP